MAYVPPHKRRTSNNDNGSEGSSSPKPALPSFLIKKGKNHRHKSAGTSSGSAYKYDSIFKWFAVGVDDHNHLPPSVHLRTISGETLDGKILDRQVLYHDSYDDGSCNRAKESFTRQPWEFIAENLLQDLLSSFDEYRSIRESDKVDEQVDDPETIFLIARFGKVFFSGRHLNYEQEFKRTNLLSEDSLRPVRSSFYTNIPESYVEYLIHEGASKSGLEYEHEKEVYRVYFGDVTQPGKSMWCKCKVLEDGKLHLCKMVHNHTRYMLTDISCLEKNLDLRLDLATKRTKHVLTDEDMQSLKDLISSAIVDANLKIGLRWPLGKTVSGNKFFLCKVWRITSKAFKGPLLRLKIREVFRSTSEEATREVFVMLKGLTSKLLKKDADKNLISEMFKADLKVLWNNILCCDEHFPNKIIFEQSLGSTWCVVGLDDHDEFPPSVHLQPHPLASFHQKDGALKPLALINSGLVEQSCSKVTDNITRSPWEYIVESVLLELLSSFGEWKREMKSKDVNYTPIVIARIGKVIFHRKPFINKDFATANFLSVDELTPVKKSLYTNVPISYVEHIVKEGASKSGLKFEKEKEAFRVYLSDTTERDEYMLCKCRVLKEDGKLQLYKIQPSDTFAVIKQISCLEKNLDMRLEVISKKTETDLLEDDKQMIRNLIDSAVVDSNVQGGLRWPLGKTGFGRKFRVYLTSHITCKVYKNSSLKLKINEVDEYYHESSKGLVEKEVVMSLKGLSSELLKEEVHINVVNEVLKEELKVIWNNFL